jgi:serine/threonine protein phosphatase PrpC
MMAVVGAGLSDRGLRRETNEDSFAYLPDLDLFLVADGVGGHAAGEVASQTAVSAITSKIQELLTDDDLTPLHDARGYPCVGARRLLIAVEHANQEIFRCASTNSSQRGMGTTVAALHFADGFANLCHVGDSRIYRIRDGKIERLTKDHAIAVNVLSQALGTEPTVDATWRIEPLAPGECFVLCTDGVHGLIADDEILSIVERHADDYAAACQALIALANERGGRDNSTAVVVGTR